MPENALRWGILGVAKINERLLPAFAQAENAQLLAIASRSLEKAQVAARAAAIPRAHGSYEALLADPDIDAVYIPLPNHLHAEWTRKAADRGKHVLCEKPLCPTAAEAGDLIAYCKTRGIALMDGFMWPHHPRTALLRQFLDQGSIGAVRHVTGTFTFPLDLGPANIRLSAEMGGGSLLDVGCYPVFGIRWAMRAEPVRVWASARMEQGVDLSLLGALWFADGRTASFDCGFTHPLRQWLEIVGTTGTVTVPEMWLPPPRALFQVRREGGNHVEEMGVEGRDQIVQMIEDFSRAVLEKKPPAPAPEEAVMTLRVLDALIRSAREGRPVDL